MSSEKPMTIKVTNKGCTNDGRVDMCFDIVGRRPLSLLNEIYFLAVINGLRDTDERAFLGAMDMFFKHELGQGNDEE